jgi:diacylglycerol kinase family enzyme
MATTLALSRDIKTAVKSVLRGHPVPLDIGCFNDQFFIYIAAFGAFTGVSYSTPRSAKRALGIWRISSRAGRRLNDQAAAYGRRV